MHSGIYADLWNRQSGGFLADPDILESNFLNAAYGLKPNLAAFTDNLGQRLAIEDLSFKPWCAARQTIAGAVEIVADRATREPFPKEARLAQRAARLMERHGLLGRGGDIFPIAPPLCVTRGEADFLVSQLEAVIAELQADLLTRGKAA